MTKISSKIPVRMRFIHFRPLCISDINSIIRRGGYDMEEMKKAGF